MQQNNTNHAALTEGYVKEYYNTELKNLDENYTNRRWFASVESKFDYEQTKYAFLSAVGSPEYASGLEVGPGDGVWTNMIAERFDALELLDQSEEMLKRAKEVLSAHTDITYTNANFADHELSASKYDFIFSVRCFEYVVDKADAIKKFYNALMPGSTFVLITKNPGYKTQKEWNKPLLHTQQIGKKELVSLLQKQGFVVDAVYPAVMRWKSKYMFFRGIFWLLHRIAVLTKGRVYVPWLTDASTESYTYVLTKPTRLVEFYGLSGAGKTTLAKELTEKDSIMKSIRLRKRGVGFRHFVFHNPVIFFFWLKEMFYYALFHGDRVLFRHRLSILLSTFEVFGSAQRAQKGIVVLEEGLFQRIFSIYEQKRSADDFIPLLKRLPKIDMLVVVDRGDNHFSRYKLNGDNPRAHLGESYMSTWKEIILHNNESLLRAIKMVNVPMFFMGKDSTSEQLIHKLKSL
jgi:ubiquinone/menaquinone biosynthesis C-methylase UbiE